MLQSSLVEVLDAPGLEAVIGHEVGHIVSEHALYRTVLNLLLTLSAASSPLISAAMFPIMMALLEWNRKAELSCDRAGLLDELRRWHAHDWGARYELDYALPEH